MMNLCEAKVLSYAEYRTAAIYHASVSALETIDKVQRSFLADIGVDETSALLDFNLAPLFRFAARHRDARLDTQNCAGTRACALPEGLLHRNLRAQTQQETSTAPPSIARVPERQVFGCGLTFGVRPDESIQPDAK